MSTIVLAVTAAFAEPKSARNTGGQKHVRRPRETGGHRHDTGLFRVRRTVQQHVFAVYGTRAQILHQADGICGWRWPTVFGWRVSSEAPTIRMLGLDHLWVYYKDYQASCYLSTTERHRKAFSSSCNVVFLQVGLGKRANVP